MTEKTLGGVKKTLAILFLRDQVFWKGTPLRRLARVGVLSSYFYLGVLVLLVALEDRMFYPGATFARPWLAPPASLPVRELSLPSEDGATIHAWFTTPGGWSPSDGAILYSHGNGNNISRLSNRAGKASEHLKQAVLLYDYPGYGKSTGKVSERGCYAAGESALRWLTEEAKVPEQKVILVGESLGGGIATELATRHDARLLVLCGAFTSCPDMAQKRFPIFPARYLVHNRMENERKIACVRCPTCIVHGTHDSIVPFSQGERLFAAAPGPKRFLRIEGGGHAPPNTREFYQAVNTFLAETER